MRRTKGAAATVLAVTATLMIGTTAIGATTEPGGSTAGECPRDIAAAAAAATTAPAATEAPAAVETTAAADVPETDRGRSPGDDRGRTGRHRSSADAAGERQRARRRRDHRHQPAAPRQPAAGRHAAPAGRLTGRELEPQPSRRQRERLLLRATADDVLSVVDRQRGRRHVEHRLRRRVRRVRRPPHADLHPQPRRGVARRHPDHRRRLAGDVERPQRARTRSSKSCPARATS